MRPDLELTSVPGWAVTPTGPDADLTGRSWTVIGFGTDAEAVLEGWRAQVAEAHPGAELRVHTFPEGFKPGSEPESEPGSGSVQAAVAAMQADLADARVGWRLMVAGPAHLCLRLRAAAVRAGVADDELTVASTSVDRREVQCVHCGAVTGADVALEDVLPCGGCGRNLLVYYHVSRRLGTHLGFQVDAEALPEALAS
ncbi:dimethylamine monooxygenase subunit DmmA family protein [Mycolicibacterium palauense]|uniref:dimethylamine monooxygenase subunit DmmA family protein n=1 Tax=Mycolicibacterium palauense TaxID=2034511 RepID=UPI000BFF084D|nr:dimethylamine monooxygenase subunit DmmA family protein [Mycolicibacterium palauense]